MVQIANCTSGEKKYCRAWIHESAFGIISPPFISGAIIQHHLNKYKTNSAHIISKSLYVDNIVTGFQSEDDATKFYKESNEFFSDTSMNVRQWTSQYSEVLRCIPERDKIIKEIVSVLGVGWNLKVDMLSIQLAKCCSADEVGSSKINKCTLLGFLILSAYSLLSFCS